VVPLHNEDRRGPPVAVVPQLSEDLPRLSTPVARLVSVNNSYTHTIPQAQVVTMQVR
jgi:hypothetical protein